MPSLSVDVTIILCYCLVPVLILIFLFFFSSITLQVVFIPFRVKQTMTWCSRTEALHFPNMLSLEDKLACEENGGQSFTQFWTLSWPWRSYQGENKPSNPKFKSDSQFKTHNTLYLKRAWNKWIGMNQRGRIPGSRSSMQSCVQFKSIDGLGHQGDMSDEHEVFSFSSVHRQIGSLGECEVRFSRDHLPVFSSVLFKHETLCVLNLESEICF